MTAESAQRCFFETYDNLEDNRQQQRLLLKPNYLEAFKNDINRRLEQKSKFFVVENDELPLLRDTENFRTKFLGCWKNIFQAFKSLKAVVPILSELSNLEKKLKTENLSDSKKEQSMCNEFKQLFGKLDEIHAEWIRLIERHYCTRKFEEVCNTRSYYRDLINKYVHSKDYGNQTSLISSTSAGAKEPKATARFEFSQETRNL